MGLLSDLNNLIDDVADLTEQEDDEKMKNLMRIGRGNIRVVYPDADKPEKSEPEAISEDDVILGGGFYTTPKGVF